MGKTFSLCVKRTKMEQYDYVKMNYFCNRKKKMAHNGT